MSNSNHEHKELFILYLVDNSVVTRANSPQVKTTTELHTSRWPGIRFQGKNRNVYLLLHLESEAAQCASRRRSHFNLVCHSEPKLLPDDPIGHCAFAFHFPKRLPGFFQILLVFELH